MTALKRTDAGVWCSGCLPQAFNQRRLRQCSRPVQAPQTCAAQGRKAPQRQSSRQQPSRQTPADDGISGQSIQVLTVNHPDGAPIVPPQSNPNGTSALEQEPDESRDFAIAMAEIAHETKGSDIVVLHVAPLIYWTSYMVIVTVFSRPQLGAVLGRMEKEAAERWGRQLSQGGHPGRTEWEVLDLQDVVVHVFTAEQREFYEIESFYGAAEEVDLPFLQQDSTAAAGSSVAVDWRSS